MCIIRRKIITQIKLKTTRKNNTLQLQISILYIATIIIIIETHTVMD